MVKAWAWVTGSIVEPWIELGNSTLDPVLGTDSWCWICVWWMIICLWQDGVMEGIQWILEMLDSKDQCVIQRAMVNIGLEVWCYGKILRLEQDYRVILEQRQQPRSLREKNLRRKECLGEKLEKSFYLFSHCNFQIKQILPKGKKSESVHKPYHSFLYIHRHTERGSFVWLTLVYSIWASNREEESQPDSLFKNHSSTLSWS